MFRKAVLLLVVLMSIGCAKGSVMRGDGIALGIAGPAAPDTLRLQPYMGPLLALEVEVGADTRPFLFDTGGGFTAITPGLAQRLNVEPFGRVTGFRMSGERLDARRCGEIEMRIGSSTLRPETALFDLMALLPADWPELGGIVSLHTFAGRLLTLDTAARLVIVETRESFASRIAGMRPMSARINHQMGGSLDLFVEVRAMTGNLWLELDSGNAGDLLLAPHAFEQLGLPVPEMPGGAASEAMDLTIDLAGIGPVPCRVRAQEMIYDGLVNAATIEKLVLTMDLGAGRLWGRLRE